jgi:hypothetical protein
MAESKKAKKASSKPVKKSANKLQVVKPAKHDGILYAHVKKDNAKFWKDKAAQANVSLSTFMDQLTDKMKTGQAVSV